MPIYTGIGDGKSVIPEEHTINNDGERVDVKIKTIVKIL